MKADSAAKDLTRPASSPELASPAPAPAAAETTPARPPSKFDSGNFSFHAAGGAAVPAAAPTARDAPTPRPKHHRTTATAEDAVAQGARWVLPCPAWGSENARRRADVRVLRRGPRGGRRGRAFGGEEEEVDAKLCPAPRTSRRGRHLRLWWADDGAIFAEAARRLKEAAAAAVARGARSRLCERLRRGVVPRGAHPGLASRGGVADWASDGHAASREATSGSRAARPRGRARWKLRSIGADDERRRRALDAGRRWRRTGACSRRSSARRSRSRGGAPSAPTIFFSRDVEFGAEHEVTARLAADLTRAATRRDGDGRRPLVDLARREFGATAGESAAGGGPHAHSTSRARRPTTCGGGGRRESLTGAAGARTRRTRPRGGRPRAPFSCEDPCRKH